MLRKMGLFVQIKAWGSEKGRKKQAVVESVVAPIYPHPGPGTCRHVAAHGRGTCRRDKVKAPEMETTLAFLGGPVSSQGPHRREAGGSESELEEAAAGCEDGGRATSQGCGASRSWKRQEMVLPWSFWKDQPCPHLGLLK